MPIKLIDPRPGKTPYYTGRGTHRGVYVERSTKFTSKQKAKECIARWEREIERGEYDKKPTEPVIGPKREATFADAALAYLRADGEPNYIGAIVEYEGEYAIRDKLVPFHSNQPV